MRFRSIIPKHNEASRNNPAKRITIAFMLLSACWLLVSCENDIKKIKTFTNSVDLPSITAEGFEMLISDSTVIRTKLQTPELIMHDNEKEPYTEFPKGIIITQYDAHMHITSSITAQYAKQFKSDDRWEAKNNVVAINPRGDTLKTEYLVWDKKRGKIYSDQFVKIIQKDKSFAGTGFKSNQDFTDYSFKNLKGDIYVDVQAK